jgi:hypothetical protein
MFKKFNKKFFSYQAIHVNQARISGKEILKLLGIQAGAPVIVFMGGAAKTSSQDGVKLERAISEGVARVAVELSANVVDGGTDSGTIGMLNSALRKQKHTGFYIGVAPDQLTHLPNAPTNGHLESLGDTHTHFVLVEGEHWGDELKPLYALVDALAEGVPALRILVNGGMGTETELSEKGRDNRIVMVLEGSSRLADRISFQLRSPETEGVSHVEKMTREGDFTVFDIDLGPDQLAEEIRAYLKPTQSVEKTRDQGE